MSVAVNHFVTMEEAALVIVDMQNDFVLPTGSLSVSGATSLVPIINSVREKFHHVLITQDWHPLDHVSFVNNHPGKNVYDMVQADGYEQCLFPAHCVQNTPGAELVKDLVVKPGDLFVKKGTNSKIDSYSCFFDVVKTNPTNAHDQLTKIGVKTLYFTGVATDYCVCSSVNDAQHLGYKTYLLTDAIAGVNAQASSEAVQKMKNNGVILVKSTDI